MRLVGPPGESFFDVWTLSHLAWWFAWSAPVASQGWNQWVAFPAVMVLAVLWELGEWQLGEKRGWFSVRFHEVPLNRWVSDLLIATPAGWWFGWWMFREA